MQARFAVPGLICLALALPAAADAQKLQILVTSLTTQATPHDTAPKQKANAGDWIAFRDLLVNRVAQFGKKKGKPVAYDVGELRYISATKTVMKATATFPGIGTISFAGPFNSDANVNTLPIVGGTGAFKGVKGTITIGSGATSAPNTYDITVPGHPVDIHGGGGVA